MKAVLVTALMMHSLGQVNEGPIGSYLYEPSYKMDNVLRGQPMAYVPQPGDIMLATDVNFFWSLTHNLALAGEPHNSAVIVANKEGHLVVLEAGPDDTLFVGTNDMLPHLKHYSEKGPGVDSPAQDSRHAGAVGHAH